VSYDFVTRLEEQLKGIRFPCVLLDEAHAIKNHTVSG
jgi:SNF2 family DNA or RNA helicase